MKFIKFKNVRNVLILLIIGLLLNSCFSLLLGNVKQSYATIISQSETGAYIKGIGPSKTEAKLVALEKAKEIFINYKVKGEPEFTQEMRGSDTTVSTYWICIIEIEKE